MRIVTAVVAVVITALGYSSPSSAQSTQSYDSAVYWCVDREHIKRIRNYPCEDRERTIDQVNFSSTIVTFGSGDRSVTVDKATPTPATIGAERSKRQHEEYAAKRDSCGPRPVKPRNDYSKDKNVKRMNEDNSAFVEADRAWNQCVLTATMRR